MSALHKENKSRRVIIYGAGAIGGVIGGHLSCVGKEVVLIGRPGHMNAIREHGLRFITPAGTHILQLAAFTAPDQIDFGPDDVVLLCVKSQDTDVALRDLRAVTEDVPVFCIQNGVRNEEIAAQYFPRVYGAAIRVGGAFLTDGEVIGRSDPLGVLFMGRYPTGTDDLVEAVAANLRAAEFLVFVTPNLMPYKYGKLMVNLVNAVGAITDAKDYILSTNPIAHAARQEAAEILAQAGIRWIPMDDWPRDLPEMNIPARGRVDVGTKSSAWQSLASGTGKIETEFFNGEIVRLAKQLGRQAPINEMLLRISEEMAVKRELPGKYTTDELCRLAGMD